MEGFRCVIPITVRFRDCDALGHVNNAVFFTYLEEARFHWFRTVFASGFGEHPIILAEARCSFRSPAKHAEILEVGIRVERIGRSSFTHGYRVEALADRRASPASEERPAREAAGRASDRRLVAEAESVGVRFDYGANQSRELGEEFRRAVLAHQGALPEGESKPPR
jgi:acyl-CoA thioester hydrolase